MRERSTWQGNGTGQGYRDIELDKGEYYHVIRFVWDGKYHQDYRIKDSTGELEEK